MAIDQQLNSAAQHFYVQFPIQTIDRSNMISAAVRYQLIDRPEPLLSVGEWIAL